MKTKIYLVRSKGDDYGKERTELVETTAKNAKEYYHFTEVPPEDVAFLKKYLEFIDFDEEQERDAETRFYGG